MQSDFYLRWSEYAENPLDCPRPWMKLVAKLHSSCLQLNFCNTWSDTSPKVILWRRSGKLKHILFVFSEGGGEQTGL